MHPRGAHQHRVINDNRTIAAVSDHIMPEGAGEGEGVVPATTENLVITSAAGDDIIARIAAQPPADLKSHWLVAALYSKRRQHLCHQD